MPRPIKAHKTQEKGIYYKQCKLKKGGIHQIAYIPEEFAELKGMVKIKNKDGWDDGWVVEEVGARVDESFLDGMRNAVKHQREVSDI